MKITKMMKLSEQFFLVIFLSSLVFISKKSIFSVLYRLFEILKKKKSDFVNLLGLKKSDFFDFWRFLEYNEEKQKLIFILYHYKIMVITEENGNPFAEQSLADQLLEHLPSEKVSASPLSDSMSPSVPVSDPISQKQELVSHEKDTATIDLLDDSNLANSKEAHADYSIKRYNSRFIFTLLGIVLVGWALVCAYLFYQYLNSKSQPSLSTSVSERVQKTSNIYNSYGQSLGFFSLDDYAGIALEKDQMAGARKILSDDKLNFVQKKDLLEEKLGALGQRILEYKILTKELREKMNRDGFFPQELVDILKTDNAVGSIQRSLLSLEVVKFSSAMKVFSLMDVFVSQLADNLGYTKSDIREKLFELLERGERDVEYYLNVCYNNPYEPTKCDKINDFDVYYKSILGDQELDTHFFKNLMEFINNKLEFSTMPSFSITFNSFDGKSNSIAFTIEVNTLKEDEYALIQQGIKSPHIFIVSELIKLLKQSTFILGKAIDAKDIKVTPKQVSIWNAKYLVNNSIKNFNLPIQKTTEREIFDFTDTYVSRFQMKLKNQKTEKEDLSSLQDSQQKSLSGTQLSSGAFVADLAVFESNIP